MIVCLLGAVSCTLSNWLLLLDCLLCEHRGPGLEIWPVCGAFNYSNPQGNLEEGASVTLLF